MHTTAYLESRRLWLNLLWFNIITSAIAILQEVSILGIISQEWVLIGNVIGNVLLRLITTQLPAKSKALSPHNGG